MERTTAKWQQSREKYCSTCDSRTHETRDCWGKCPYCGKYNHKADFRDKTEKAHKTENKKKSKKNKKAKKTIDQRVSRKESEEENSVDSDVSEEDSLRKRPIHRGRAARAGLISNPYGDLRQQLNNMKQD